MLARFLGALALVYLSYNPEEFSLYHWIVRPLADGAGLAAAFTPLKVLAALVLAIGWAVFVQAVQRSLGTRGALMLVALTSCSWRSRCSSPWACRGRTSRKLTGQVDTDEVA